jgi:hypothetical protein
MKKFITLLLIAFAFGACAALARTEKEEFTVSLRSPQISMGIIDAQLDKTFPLPGIKKINVTMSYFPREDAVCLQYKVDLMTYYQFWNRSGRAAFLKALEEYKEDYAARSLERRGGNQAKRKYGIVEGFLIWQLNRYTTQSNSKVNLEIGYSFQENLPYFTVNQGEGEFIDPSSPRDIRQTLQIPMYFTRAQADELAILFDQQYLQGLAAAGVINDDDFYDDDYDENELQSETEIQTDEY